MNIFNNMKLQSNTLVAFNVSKISAHFLLGKEDVRTLYSHLLGNWCQFDIKGHMGAVLKI